MRSTTGAQTSLRVRYRWRVVAAVAGVVIGGAVIALASVVPFSSETARRNVIDVLAARLDAEVELADLQLRVLPQFHVEGHGLSIRHKGRRDVPPMIAIARFSADGNVVGLLRRHIARVVVDQLDIQIPPDRNRDVAPAEVSSSPSDRGAGSQDVARTFVIDELVSNDGQLVIIPRDHDKHPKVWSIHRLRMHSVSIDRAMPYVATLDNLQARSSSRTAGSPFRTSRSTCRVRRFV